jgi:hypothetical protein
MATIIQSISPFAYFDDIVCINMETRPERRAYAQSVFDEHNIPARFFTAKKHLKGGKYGCFDSHIQVVKEAYDSGKETLLVFEDDLLPTKEYTQENVENAVQFMKNETCWDIFYFGYMPFNFNLFKFGFFAPSLKKYPNVMRFNPFATHAMCYSRQGMKKVLDTYEKYIGEKHYDIYLSYFSTCVCYCNIPVLIDQKYTMESDIPAYNIAEACMRSISGLCEKTQIIQRGTTLRYNTNQHILALTLALIAFLPLYKVFHK